MRGGPSSEYDVSLKTGTAILNALRGPLVDEYQAIDIFIDRAGVWHIDGIQVSPADLSSRIDVVINALHGAFGEDGTVQSILEAHGVPFTGSPSFASALGMNKAHAKESFKRQGVKTPLGKVISASDIFINADLVAVELFRSFPMPVIMKPVSGGSSIGVSVAGTIAELVPALQSAAEHGDVLVEEFISGGVEATVGVVEGFRGQELYALPVIEIRVPRGKVLSDAVFDYAKKYAASPVDAPPVALAVQEIIPASFSPEIKSALEDLAKKAHASVGARHYSRTDFIVHPRRGIYALEINTLPGLTEQSLVPRALSAVGSNVHEFVRHIISLAEKAK